MYSLLQDIPNNHIYIYYFSLILQRSSIHFHGSFIIHLFRKRKKICTIHKLIMITYIADIQ